MTDFEATQRNQFTKPQLEQFIDGLCGHDSALQQRASSIFRALQEHPIIDIHTHYDQLQVKGNVEWKTPVDFFLGKPAKILAPGESNYGFDHYVAQVMHQKGVDSALIYGDFDQFKAKDTTCTPEQFPFRRFKAMVEALKGARGSEVEQWFRITLDTVFDFRFNRDTRAEDLWSAVAEKLKQIKPQSLLKEKNVLVALTTDDPISDLSVHQRDGGPKLIPTWRPDAVLMIGTDPDMTRYNFPNWIQRLANSAEMNISTVGELEGALRKRLTYFKTMGCIAADLGIQNFRDESCTEEEASQILNKALLQQPLTEKEIHQWQGFMLEKLLKLNAEFGLRQYIHQGARRDINSTLFAQYGPDIGADAPGERLNVAAMVKLFNRLGSEKAQVPFGGFLAPTIIFPINREDYSTVAHQLPSLCQHVGNAGRAPLQLGPPWWFYDKVKDIQEMIRMHISNGTLSDWVGMLSDARSLGSVVARMPWFRAILAVELASHAQFQHDTPEQLASDFGRVCFDNAARWLGLNPQEQRALAASGRQ